MQGESLPGRASSRTYHPSLRGRFWIAAAALGMLLVWFALRELGVSLRRDETWPRILREGVLRVGMDASYPPFELVDDEGRFRGYDVDLVTELARRCDIARFLAVVPVFDARATTKK